jgi:hypothetical protein
MRRDEERYLYFYLRLFTAGLAPHCNVAILRLGNIN